MKLKEIARELGVSASCISIVREGRPGVSAGTRRRVQMALENNGYSYVPFAEPPEPENETAPSGNPRICLLKHYSSALLTDNNEGFVESIIDTVEASARQAGYSLVMNSVSREQYPAMLETVNQEDYAGMLVIATEMNREEVAMLERVSIPLVVLDTDLPMIPHSSVSMNNRQLAWTAVSRLASCGEVGYLQSSQATGNFEGRSIGYHEAVRALGLPSSDDLIFSITPSLFQAGRDMDFWIEQNRRIPRAFFADNDVIAIGCIRSMMAHGIRIPEDTQVIGVDNTLLSQVLVPSLSSMQISKANMGELAIRQLLRHMRTPSLPTVYIRTEAQLIDRQSTL